MISILKAVLKRYSEIRRKTIVMPMIRRRMPKSIAEDIVGVQPMSSSHAEGIFKMESKNEDVVVWKWTSKK